jgi:hypothetical protein
MEVMLKSAYTRFIIVFAINMLITNFQLIWILLFQFQETLIFDDELIQLGLILFLIILDVALISIFIRKMLVENIFWMTLLLTFLNFV